MPGSGRRDAPCEPQRRDGRTTSPDVVWRGDRFLYDGDPLTSAGFTARPTAWRSTDPPLQVHALDGDTFILRQSKS